jgi:hypothetical protein
VATLQQAVSTAEQTGDRNLEATACRLLHELGAAAGDPDAAAYYARAQRAYAYLARVSQASAELADASSTPPVKPGRTDSGPIAGV